MHLLGTGKFYNCLLKGLEEQRLILVKHRCLIVLPFAVYFRNYDSTASLEAFFGEEGISSLLLNRETSEDDISDIIDTGIIYCTITLTSKSFFMNIIIYSAIS